MTPVKEAAVISSDALLRDAYNTICSHSASIVCQHSYGLSVTLMSGHKCLVCQKEEYVPPAV